MANTLQGKKSPYQWQMDSSNQKLLEPRQALDDAGAQTQVVSPVDGNVKRAGIKQTGAPKCPSSCCLTLRIPQGMTRSHGVGVHAKGVRMHYSAGQQQRFAKHFLDAGKPVTAICHGPRTVVEMEAARGCTLTSWPSLKTDIRNAGGTWVDKDVATDKRVSNESQTG
jgi:deglycase